MRVAVVAMCLVVVHTRVAYTQVVQRFLPDSVEVFTERAFDSTVPPDARAMIRVVTREFAKAYFNSLIQRYEKLNIPPARLQVTTTTGPRFRMKDGATATMNWNGDQMRVDSTGDEVSVVLNKCELLLVESADDADTLSFRFEPGCQIRYRDSTYQFDDTQWRLLSESRPAPK